MSKLRIDKKWKCGRLDIRFKWRSKKNLMGRFGGGWNWKLGLQTGGSTIVISLLICEIMFSYESCKGAR